MIQSYAGEFTISPIPLEMSMNYCSHKCAYCFANLNQPNRTLDANKVINQIKNCHNTKSLTSFYLKNQYPVLLSNKVDPFASTNWRQTLSFIELLHANGNKIAFQTKGGNGIDEALALLDYKASWYISISFFYDNYRQIIEPGATSIAERFELIEKLIAKGHHVSVGINPLVEEWLPTEDFEMLIDKLKSIGVKNVWIEVLHLNSNQIKNMSAKEQKNIGDEILTEAKKRKRNNSYFRYCLQYAIDAGMNVYSMNQPMASKYFDEYHNLYKTLKTHQDFINHCFDKLPNGGLIRYGYYYNFMYNESFDHVSNEADGYLYRIARNIWKDNGSIKLKTIKEVMAAYWDFPECSKSIFQNQLFSQVVIGKGDERQFVIDDRSDMWMAYFDPKGETSQLHSTMDELQAMAILQ